MLILVSAWLLYRLDGPAYATESPDHTHPAYMKIVRMGAAASAVLLFVLLMSLALLLNASKKEINNVLYHYEPRTSSIYVNGRSTPNGSELIWLLKHPDHIDTTTQRQPRSQPKEQIAIRILNVQDSTLLHLRRDSHTKNEYWVFYPAYTVTGYMQIGKIWTNALDGY